VFCNIVSDYSIVWQFVNLEGPVLGHCLGLDGPGIGLEGWGLSLGFGLANLILANHWQKNTVSKYLFRHTKVELNIQWYYVRYCLFGLAETPQFCGVYVYIYVCIILKTAILIPWVGGSWWNDWRVGHYSNTVEWYGWWLTGAFLSPWAMISMCVPKWERLSSTSFGLMPPKPHLIRPITLYLNWLHLLLHLSHDVKIAARCVGSCYET